VKRAFRSVQTPSAPSAEEQDDDEEEEVISTFGGFLMKADSEGIPGPSTFSRSESERVHFRAISGTSQMGGLPVVRFQMGDRIWGYLGAARLVPLTQGWLLSNFEKSTALFFATCSTNKEQNQHRTQGRCKHPG